MRKMDSHEARNTKGGTKYVCRWCGYTSTNYFSTYAALKCVNKRFGKNIYNIVDKVIGSIFSK